MNGLTLSEAKLLHRALNSHKYNLEKERHDEKVEAELEHIATLKTELVDFIQLVGDQNNLLELWTDGAARPTNPGPAGIGIVGKINDHVVIEIAEHIGKTTNNVAEYQSAVTGLRRAVDIGVSRVFLHSDSKIMVNQFTGEWRCNDESLKPLLGRLRGLASRFTEFRIEWISRTKNREADGLSVAGAYAPRACGACGHSYHTSFCLVADLTSPTGQTCGCPHGFREGLRA